MKVSLVIMWLGLIFSGISWFFWKSELQYQLPTPVPVNYTKVNTGQVVNLQGKIETKGKPLFIHFFNPACPCSRFNVPHVESLAKKYGSEFDFAIVVLDKNKTHSVEEIQDKFGMSVPVLFDSTLAASCGVYSTPQAVILDAGNRLYFRGNYNKSRHCTDKSSEYARMAIDSFLTEHSNPAFGAEALTAYGCQLPTTCSK